MICSSFFSVRIGLASSLRTLRVSLESILLRPSVSVSCRMLQPFWFGLYVVSSFFFDRSFPLACFHSFSNVFFFHSFIRHSLSFLVLLLFLELLIPYTRFLIRLTVAELTTHGHTSFLSSLDLRSSYFVFSSFVVCFLSLSDVFHRFQVL
jgi:hypothetical protein